MASPTNYYVDPVSGSDSTGTGTIGNPWKTVNKALTTITQDSTSGDQINVKDSGTDTLTTSLNLTSYGTPSGYAHLTIRGYTSTANDGGKGVIDGAGSYLTMNENTKSFINFIDMDLKNSGSNYLFQVGTYCTFIRCNLSNSSHSGGLFCGENARFFACSFTDFTGLSFNNHARFEDCYFKNGGTRSFTHIHPSFITYSSVVFLRCFFSVSGSTSPFNNTSAVYNWTIANCSFLSSSGTGTGINTKGMHSSVIRDNLIEGFSGTGGVGIRLNTAFEPRPSLVAGNAVYNCTTAYENLSADQVVHQDPGDSANDNETLSASPFAKSGSDTFANRKTYFAPVDTGNVVGGSYLGNA